MILDVPIKLAGLIFAGFGFAHFAFPKRFHWSEELSRLSLLNRRIFMVHCAFIVIVLLLLGALCTVFTRHLLEPSPLAKVVLSGIEIFCLLRLLAQFFAYDAALWRGHAFNTRVHVLFVVAWTYLVVVFGASLVQVSAA